MALVLLISGSKRTLTAKNLFKSHSLSGSISFICLGKISLNILVEQVIGLKATGGVSLKESIFESIGWRGMEDEKVVALQGISSHFSGKDPPSSPRQSNWRNTGDSQMNQDRKWVDIFPDEGQVIGLWPRFPSVCLPYRGTSIFRQDLRGSASKFCALLCLFFPQRRFLGASRTGEWRERENRSSHRHPSDDAPNPFNKT